MRILRPISMLVAFFFVAPVWLLSQSVVAVSGGNISGSSGTAGYSVGQLLTGESTGTGGRVILGMQQVYDIIIINNISEGNIIKLEAKVYPNPVEDILNLSIPGDDMSGFTLRLFDSRGTLLRQHEIESSETPVQMGNFAAGIYYINVYRYNQQAAVFKIVKK